MSAQFSEHCTDACVAMPDCAVCKMRKHPRGRDPGVYASSGYCGTDCTGYYEDPQAGHAWPSEWRDHVAELAQPHNKKEP